MNELVLYELCSPAAVLTINRADKRNALSQALIAELTKAFDRAGKDASARCIILTGAGPTFCAGMDLTELRESVDRNPGSEEVWADAMKLATLYDRIYTSPKPTIAAVNGAAVAGGAGLVTVCDLAISVPTAQFGYPEVRRGLVAAMVMPHLLRHVGERLARHLLLTGELIGAEAAARGGLINESVPHEHLLPRALELSKSLAEGGPQALAATKSLLHQFSRQALSIEEAARASAAPRLTDECRDGLRAFFEKKAPPWSA
jgi:methylglutaconyl-CoA hydratase